MLSIVLMAKLIPPKKVTLLFQLCDEDDDGVLSSDQFLDMLTRVEKIFQVENAME